MHLLIPLRHVLREGKRRTKVQALGSSSLGIGHPSQLLGLQIKGSRWERFKEHMDSGLLASRKISTCDTLNFFFVCVFMCYFLRVKVWDIPCIVFRILDLLPRRSGESVNINRTLLHLRDVLLRTGSINLPTNNCILSLFMDVLPHLWKLKLVASEAPLQL